MWGYSPADFWNTPPQVFWWTAEAKTEQQKEVPRYAGGMTESQVEAIYHKAYGAE